MSNVEALKSAVIQYAQKMIREKLVTGTSGNISCIDREKGLVVITPTSVDYELLEPEHMTVLDLNGNRQSGLKESSETQMHLAIYRRRPEVGAVVHTHSMYATTFAVLGEPIPAIHYMVTALGSNQIPITDKYELYGTERLAEEAVAAMGEYCKAVLLRSHGQIAVGADLAEAYKNTGIVEEMAQLYFNTRQLGTPAVLNEHQTTEVMTAMKVGSYGKASFK